MNRLIPALLVSLLACACDYPVEPAITVVGTIERDRLELVAESNERITGIRVREGARVAAGDIILVQDAALYQVRLEQLQAAKQRVESRLAERVRGPRREEISAARARLAGAESELEVQRREYERIARLVEEQLASPALLDQALERREKAAASRDQARAALDALLEGTTAEELAQEQASVREAEAAIRAQELLIERLTITAPRDGVIDALPYEAGERPAPGATVAVLLAAGLPYARVHIPEAIRSRVQPDTRALIRVDGIDRAFEGRVRHVSGEADFTPYFALTQRDRSRLSYAAEIDFTEDAAADIPSGVPLEVSFPALAAQAGG